MAKNPPTGALLKRLVRDNKRIKAPVRVLEWLLTSTHRLKSFSKEHELKSYETLKVCRSFLKFTM